jgi:hypothetical protein
MVDLDRIRRLMEDETQDLPPITMEQARETRRLFEIDARIAAEREGKDR